MDPTKVARLLDKFLNLALDVRFQLLWDSICETSGAEYQKPNYQCAPRFAKDDIVVICMGGLFWNVKIVNVKKTIFLHKEVEKLIPVYDINYVGWPQNHNEVDVAEYSLWAREGPALFSFQMLYAYFWNQYELPRQEKNLKKKKMKKLNLGGVYSPSADDVQALELMWMKEAHAFTKIRFADLVKPYSRPMS